VATRGEVGSGTGRGEVGSGTGREEVGSGTGRGDVVGFAAALLHVDVAHMLDVLVAPHERRRGTATALLTELADRTRAGGAVAQTLEVRPGNTGAQALYRRLGFVVEGRRPRYYPDGEDAVLMWRRDAS
jgi:ribosomal protein S18 acetylase RimI-like enzyme